MIDIIISAAVGFILGQIGGLWESYKEHNEEITALESKCLKYRLEIAEKNKQYNDMKSLTIYYMWCMDRVWEALNAKKQKSPK